MGIERRNTETNYEVITLVTELLELIPTVCP